MTCLTHTVTATATVTIMMDPSSPLHRTSSYHAANGSQADTLLFGSDGMLTASDDIFSAHSMKKSPSGYFNAKPMRGSSPTASLAADLSQNFHIAQSPGLPTPRRSLFVTRNNVFNGSKCNATSTIPPTPSSPGMDAMDLSSPLPHKVPFASAAPLLFRSPTPELTPSVDSSSLVESPVPQSLPEPPALPLPQEKKRVRPNFARPKGQSMSTNNVPQRRLLEGQFPLPPFEFCNGDSKSTRSSSLSLSEAFEDSPPSEKSRPGTSSVMAAPRSKAFCNAFPNIRGGCGSPVSNHSRKPSYPARRPAKLQRRTLSMYEHPADVVQQKVVASPLDMAVDQPHVLRLPHFESEQVGDLPRITGATMIDVLDGKFSHLHDKVLVVDCRFEYEYDGGHINGAVNFNDKEKLAEHLFNISSPTTTSRSLIIFHCEYSAHRAPIMAKFLRSHDRTVNGERYPALTYPEAYILDGGYSSFFKHYRSRCFPQEYVEMDSQEHASACEKGLGKVKQQRPGKIRRSNTFAMGQGSSPMGSSPMGARALQRHVSESMWSPKAIGRARSRNTSESTVEAMTLSPGDTRMSDADSEIDFIVDIPSFKPITAGRLSLFGTGAQGRPSLFGPGGGAQTRRWESSHT